MNRPRGAWTSSASSRASPSTTCQKCLKKGHYSYECKASQVERPYISRPSRTQQLLNPNVRQKLTMAAPPDEKKDHDMLRKEGTADAILAQKAKERKEAKKRRRDSVSPSPPPRRARRSPSTSSVSSYSSASSARSPTPPRRSHSRRSRSRSPDRRVRRKYRESPSPPHGRGRRLDQEEQRKRSNSRSRDVRERRTPLPSSHPQHSPKPPRERSLSPFSRRLALTKAMARGS